MKEIWGDTEFVGETFEHPVSLFTSKAKFIDCTFKKPVYPVWCYDTVFTGCRFIGPPPEVGGMFDTTLWSDSQDKFDGLILTNNVFLMNGES